MSNTQPATRRHVVVFGLGGTIAMTRSTEGGVAPALSAEQLVDAVPGLRETGITVTVEDFRRVPGASLTFSDMTDLVDSVAARATAGGVDGIVITQGTDTIEETAYLLDLLYRAPQPLVVTGAMRNPTLAGADGPANILAAIQTAACDDAAGQGCLVVLADEIHAARRVRKTHSTSGATFQSLNGGALGAVVEGRPRILNRLPHRATLPTLPRTSDKRVGLITVAFGDDGALVEAVADRVDGLIIAAFGVGHVPANLVPLLEKVAARVPVVLASRTGAGSTLHDTYGFPGSERDLLARDLIGAGFLDPLKARILLHCLITAGVDHATIAAAFAAAGGYADADSWPWATTTKSERSRRA